MHVTVDDLDNLASALRQAWNRSDLERRAAPVWRAFEQARPGRMRDDLVEFFEQAVRQVVADARHQPSVAVGAILWHELHVRMLVFERHPLLEPATLARLGNSPEWPAIRADWWQRYGFPSPDDKAQVLALSRSQAYEHMRTGKARLAEVLSQPRTGRELGRVSVTQADGWAKLLRALAQWYDTAPELTSHSLSARYVPPRLLYHASPSRPAQVVTEGTLLDWADQGRVVVIRGGAGLGKSTLLRHLGLKLLSQDQLPVWLEPGDQPGSATALAAHLAGQVGLPYALIQDAVQTAVSAKRLLLLVDTGEAWTQSAVRNLLFLRATLDAGLIIATREARPWAALEQARVSLDWPRSRLRAVMARHGQTRLWPVLAALLDQQRLMGRPWEFAQAAQVSHLENPSVLTMLAAALQAQGAAYDLAPKTRNALLAVAWQLVVQQRTRWRPLNTAAEGQARQAVEARIMVKDGEHYRFAHDLWRDFLAAQYAARQPAAQQVVDDLIGLTDWPQILAWAIQSAWEDGRSAWALEALQALFNALTQTWRQTACLQAAHVLKSLPDGLAQQDIAQQVRHYIERALIDQTLADWQHDPEFVTQSIVGEALADALLAIAPLSTEAVETLWQIVYVRSTPAFTNELETGLLREPGLARRILADPLHLPQTQRYTYVEQLGRAPGVQPEALIAHVQQFFPPGADQFSALVAGLVAQGTPAAASALVAYLAHLQGDEAREAFRLENFLKHWPGEPGDLWRYAPRLLAKEVAPEVAHHFLTNLLPLSELTDDESRPDDVRAFLDHLPADLSEGQQRAIEAVRSEREFHLIQRRVAEADSHEPLPSVEDIPQLLDGLFAAYQSLNVSALQQFSAEQIDQVLRTRPLEPEQRIDLAQLGTPYAVQCLLNWMQEDPTFILGRTLTYPSPRYREATWPLLAAAAESEPQEIRRYHLFSAVDILWLEQSAWPWQLVEFFFAHLADRDQVVAEKYRDTLLQKAAGHPLPAAWSGLTEPEQAAYAAGLTRYALNGDLLERVIALRFLANMPTDLVGHVLTTDTLNRLLTDPDERLLGETLDYIAAHARRDVLANVRRLASATGLQRLWPEVQSSVVSTLGQLGDAADAERLLELVREAGHHWAAVAQLIEHRRYWPALHQAIERGAAEANWLTTVVVQHGLLLVVDAAGGLVIRRGAIREDVRAA